MIISKNKSSVESCQLVESTNEVETITSETEQVDAVSSAKVSVNNAIESLVQFIYNQTDEEKKQIAKDILAALAVIFADLDNLK